MVMAGAGGGVMPGVRDAAGSGSLSRGVGCRTVEQLFARLQGRTSPSGEVDYRLTRRSTLRSLAAGEVDRAEVCDAQRELMRVALGCSESAGEECPVCRSPDRLRLVRFVFGPRLPSGGRVVASAKEMNRIGRRKGDFRCYVVEVCTSCAWNHLLRSFVIPSVISPGWVSPP